MCIVVCLISRVTRVNRVWTEGMTGQNLVLTGGPDSWPDLQSAIVRLWAGGQEETNTPVCFQQREVSNFSTGCIFKVPTFLLFLNKTFTKNFFHVTGKQLCSAQGRVQGGLFTSRMPTMTMTRRILMMTLMFSVPCSKSWRSTGCSLFCSARHLQSRIFLLCHLKELSKCKKHILYLIKITSVLQKCFFYPQIFWF